MNRKGELGRLKAPVGCSIMVTEELGEQRIEGMMIEYKFYKWKFQILKFQIPELPVMPTEEGSRFNKDELGRNDELGMMN